jgi:Zn-dependent M28 family amino/carboxypeptidase
MARTLIMLLALLVGCAPKPRSEIDWRAFDADRAFTHVEKLVGFGPRPSGSEALSRTAAYIASQLRDAGLEIEEQVFTDATPRGPMQFRNIIGKTRSGNGNVIVIGSHYDTKWMTNITFVGANDAGSSSGVLLEMARVASLQPNLWFVFFDGEEAVGDYGPTDGLHGSRHFVTQLRSPREVKAMVLLDMVGDKNLNIGLSAESTPGLIQQVFAAARDVGCREYFSFRPSAMLDDHVPFLRAGIPAVDIIDFEYGSAPGKNDYWHTEHDTLDKISPRSLEIVGRTMLRLLEILQRENGR